MSWLDSSYSLARTAFSQAQKSIDKVLDISEQKKENEEEVTGNKILVRARVAFSCIMFLSSCRNYSSCVLQCMS